MATVHTSGAEAAHDLLAVLANVREGVESVIEQDHWPVAVLKQPLACGPGRTLRECIALAAAYEETPGDVPAPDADVAKDVQAGID